jgi:hypothetical protein
VGSSQACSLLGREADECVCLAQPEPFYAVGNHYVDFIGSWGAMILGHCQARVVAAVRKQATRGFSFGAPTELESRLGHLVRKAFPALERLRFVSSGTEACMHALRVARATAAQINKFDAKAAAAAKSFIKPVPHEELRREIDLFCELFTRPAVMAALKKFVEDSGPMPYLP